VAGKRLFAFYVDQKGVQPVQPDVIWDLQESENASTERTDIDAMKTRTFPVVMQSLTRYREDLLQERNRQAAIKKKYGEESLKHLIWQLDGMIASLQERKDQGEAVDLPIRNKETQKQEYMHALSQLQSLIEKETSLTMGTPDFIGLIRVVPAERADPAMKRDADVEKKGMEVAMEVREGGGEGPRRRLFPGSGVRYQVRGRKGQRAVHRGEGPGGPRAGRPDPKRVVQSLAVQGRLLPVCRNGNRHRSETIRHPEPGGASRRGRTG